MGRVYWGYDSRRRHIFIYFPPHILPCSMFDVQSKLLILEWRLLLNPITPAGRLAPDTQYKAGFFGVFVLDS